MREVKFLDAAIGGFLSKIVDLKGFGGGGGYSQYVPPGMTPCAIGFIIAPLSIAGAVTMP